MEIVIYMNYLDDQQFHQKKKRKYEQRVNLKMKYVYFISLKACALEYF